MALVTPNNDVDADSGGLRFGWQTPGQGRFFDPNDYYTQHQDTRWLDPSVMSDDEVHEWRTGTWPTADTSMSSGSDVEGVAPW